MIQRLKKQIKKLKDKRDVGLAVYGFDFSNEFHIYEHVCRLWCNGTSDYQSFSSWKQHVEQKYNHLTNDEIQSFLFYLDCLTEELLHGKEVSTKLATSLFGFVLGGLSLLGISNLTDFIEKIDLSFSSDNPVVTFLFIALTATVLLSVFFIVVLHMLEYKSKYNFLLKYKEIIGSLNKGKYVFFAHHTLWIFIQIYLAFIVQISCVLLYLPVVLHLLYTLFLTSFSILNTSSPTP